MNALFIKSKGGCLPDPDIRDVVQMSNLPQLFGSGTLEEDNSGSGGRVQHAVDDEDLRHS